MKRPTRLRLRTPLSEHYSGNIVKEYSTLTKREKEVLIGALKEEFSLLSVVNKYENLVPGLLPFVPKVDALWAVWVQLRFDRMPETKKRALRNIVKKLST